MLQSVVHGDTAAVKGRVELSAGEGRRSRVESRNGAVLGISALTAVGHQWPTVELVASLLFSCSIFDNKKVLPSEVSFSIVKDPTFILKDYGCADINHSP